MTETLMTETPMAESLSPVLPRLMLIAARFTVMHRAERVVEAVDAGVEWVQFRDHEADEGRYMDAALLLAQQR